MIETNSESILNMVNGAIMERADYEMARILENIMDVNTAAAKKENVNRNA